MPLVRVCRFKKPVENVKQREILRGAIILERADNASWPTEHAVAPLYVGKTNIVHWQRTSRNNRILKTIDHLCAVHTNRCSRWLSSKVDRSAQGTCRIAYVRVQRNLSYSRFRVLSWSGEIKLAKRKFTFRLSQVLRYFRNLKHVSLHLFIGRYWWNQLSYRRVLFIFSRHNLHFFQLSEAIKALIGVLGIISRCFN